MSEMPRRGEQDLLAAGAPRRGRGRRASGYSYNHGPRSWGALGLSWAVAKMALSTAWRCDEFGRQPGTTDGTITMSKPDLSALKQAAAGLLLPSESDEPIEVIDWNHEAANWRVPTSCDWRDIRRAPRWRRPI
jgi:nuclease A inhibitor-like protein